MVKHTLMLVSNFNGSDYGTVTCALFKHINLRIHGIISLTLVKYSGYLVKVRYE